MSELGRGEDFEMARIMLGLLESVERNGAQTQRRLAAELGIALGLVNAYLKRCVRKGLVKIGEAPARQYAYYLTPQGFAEKSRLTIDYLSYSFSFFRRAKADCGAVFATAKDRGFARIVLAGRSDLAEIAVLCAAESGVEIAAIVDPRADATHFLGLPLVKDYAAVASPFDVVIVMDVARTQATLEAATAAVGDERVLV